ncbi:MAG: substrate-binding domain-containing protein [Armatimonadota bacterium]|nr:MAG: substrate-binding domain-containing protein [Armatimonadota bacterium]
MRTAVVVFLVILVAVGAVLVWRSPTEPLSGDLYVAVPMGLYVPYLQVVEKFQALHPDVEFSQMVDTPETMAAGVEENETKPDIFISPGGHEITVLVEKGFVDPDSLVAFGSYEVAVLVPAEDPGRVSKPEDLLNPDVKVISFSYPDLTAASHAARQALQNMGLWEELEPKIQYTGCCNESFQWIVDDRAEANVQFLGCPLDPKTAEMSEKTKVKIACTLPRDTYYVPRNVAGILNTTKNRKLAKTFLEFLTSPEMLEFMAGSKMRNDQNLPLVPGPWGPEQEASPMRLREVAGS